MKHYFYFFLALCMGAVVMTSCKPKNEPDTEKSMYALRAKVSVDQSHPNADKIDSLLTEKLQSIGFQQNEYTLFLEGDSAAVASQVATKMQIVETAIKDSKEKCRIDIWVTGVLKQNIEKENKNPIRFYHYGSAENWNPKDTELGVHNRNSHLGRWVKYLRTDEGWLYDDYGDYFCQFGFDVNDGDGGEFLYLMLEHSGKEDENAHAFEWEEKYADTYLTDVIAIYGGNEPTSIVIDGRTYYKQGQVRDLNAECGGKYIYLYGTTDPVEGYEGYYLNTGSSYGDQFGDIWDYQCRMYEGSSDFDAEKFRHEPFNWGGHRFVERVVQAYNTDGSYAGQLNANSGVAENSYCIRFILTYAYHDDTKRDYAHWTEELPGNTRFADLTIPGLHDAATWSVGWDAAFSSTLKDQDLDYAAAWNLGARVFDMRLGYNDNPGAYGDFEDRCSFYHGLNISDILCRLNKFNEDIPNHFPTKEQVSSSFMILFASIENNDEPERNINIFEYFMRLLIDRYGANCFMEYREGLTLDDLKGKILVFVDSDDLTVDYSHISGGELPQVPINQLVPHYDRAAITTIKTFVNGQATGHTYDALVQNKFEVEGANEKYQCVQEALNQPVPQFLLNQMNATTHDWDHPSWPISSKLNRMICNDLANKPLPMQYQRPLGITWYDFCGTEEKYIVDFGGETFYDFAGSTLTKWLVDHNFRNQ